MMLSFNSDKSHWKVKIQSKIRKKYLLRGLFFTKKGLLQSDFSKKLPTLYESYYLLYFNVVSYF